MGKLLTFLSQKTTWVTWLNFYPEKIYLGNLITFLSQQIHLGNLIIWQGPYDPCQVKRYSRAGYFRIAKVSNLSANLSCRAQGRFSHSSVPLFARRCAQRQNNLYMYMQVEYGWKTSCPTLLTEHITQMDRPTGKQVNQRLLSHFMVSGQKPPRQNPPGHKPPDKNPLDKNPPCQKPPRQKPPKENLWTQNIFYINKFLPCSCFILLDQLTYD